jgi:nucleotide-binding universal stress UspA family protein
MGVDLTGPDTADLVRDAAQWAVKSGASLELVYAAGASYDPGAFGDPAARAVIERQNEALNRKQLQSLQALAAVIPESSRGAVSVAHAAPTDVLVEAGERAAALVVGTHGRQGLTQFWLGSVAEHVVRRARCPVLVLRGTRSA